MNRLLASLLMIGLVVGMAGAGTWAYISSSVMNTKPYFKKSEVQGDLLPLGVMW